MEGKTAHSKVIRLKLLKQDGEGSKLGKKRCIDLQIRRNLCLRSGPIRRPRVMTVAWRVLFEQVSDFHCRVTTDVGHH